MIKLEEWAKPLYFDSVIFLNGKIRYYYNNPEIPGMFLYGVLNFHVDKFLIERGWVNCHKLNRKLIRNRKRHLDTLMMLDASEYSFVEAVKNQINLIDSLLTIISDSMKELEIELVKNDLGNLRSVEQQFGNHHHKLFKLKYYFDRENIVELDDGFNAETEVSLKESKVDPEKMSSTPNNTNENSGSEENKELDLEGNEFEESITETAFETEIRKRRDKNYESLKIQEYRKFGPHILDTKLQNGLNTRELIRVCVKNSVLDNLEEKKTFYKNIGHLIYFLKAESLLRYDQEYSAIAKLFKYNMALTCSVKAITDHMKDCPKDLRKDFTKYFGSFVEVKD